MSRFFVGYQPAYNARCDSCKTYPIYGNRYKCNQCVDFDLCEECYSNNNTGVFNTSHNSDHSMKLKLSDLDSKAYPLHDRWCNGCKTEKYPGKRYRCDECEDFDLCERCYAEDRFASTPNTKILHSSSHKMTTWTFQEQKHHSFERWKAMTIKMQNYMGAQLGTRYWDKIDTDVPEQWSNLGKKIGHAFYGAPSIIPSENNGSIFGYNDTQEKHIMEIRNLVLNLNRQAWNDEIIWINFIFVSFWSSDCENMLPIIRIYRKKPPSDDYYDFSYFIEPEGRTYDSWSDFVNHNQLPECHICYPTSGWYAPDEKGYCLLTFNTSAECDTSRQLAKGGDILATVAGIGATVVGVIGLFTPLAPVAATGLAATALGTGAYGAGRGTYQLYDRASHGQSINPFDNKQSFFCWLSLVGSAFAMGSSIGLSHAAAAGAAGRHVGQSMRIAINTAIIGSTATNGIAMIAGVFNIVDRIGQGEVPALELFQLTASVLFFTNSIVNMKMASTIVKNAQQARLDGIRNQLLTDGQKLNFDQQILQERFEAFSAGNAKTGEMHGAELSLGRLDKLMQNSNWQDAFGHNNIGISAQRHTLQPTHIANGAGIILEDAAVALAKRNQSTRFGGYQVGRESKSTIFAMPSHELDTTIGNFVKENGVPTDGYVSLPGTYYGFEIKLNSNGEVIDSQKFSYSNPTFKWDASKNQAIHFRHIESNRTLVDNFPPHARIHVSYNNRTIYDFNFTQFIRTPNSTYERFKN